MTFRHTVPIAMIAGASLALAGCSAAVTIATDGDDRQIAVATVHADAYEQALYQGTLEWGESGCLVTAPDGGADPQLVVFPKGTTLTADDEIVLPDGYRFRAGDEVGLGGGFHPGEGSNADTAGIPDACLTEEIFWASGEVVQ